MSVRDRGPKTTGPSEDCIIGVAGLAVRWRPTPSTWARGGWRALQRAPGGMRSGHRSREDPR